MELEEFIAYIENDGESYESFRENVRKQMLIQRVQRGRVGSEINITEKEFAAFMETDESLVELEPELFVRQILVRGSDEADAVILRIENGEEFFEIAKEVSIGSNSINGGELPWRKIVDMPELFSNALKNEDIGFISEPLKSGAGFHILKEAHLFNMKINGFHDIYYYLHLL
jgi:peptidyl-prolyl cis-trans isomerase SurA